MLLENLQTYIKSYKKGTYTSISWKSTLSNKKSKALNYKVEKVVSGLVRLGINYQNTKYASIHKPTSEVQRPSWFHHTEVREIIEHNTNGRQYLQCYTSSNKFKTRWLLNDQEVSLSYLLSNGLVNQSDITKTDEICVMNLPIENIIKLGK